MGSVYPRPMRTIRLDDDVAAALDRRCRTEGRGMNEVANDLIRAALAASPPLRAFVQQTADLGPGIDVTDVAEALLDLEGPSFR